MAVAGYDVERLTPGGVVVDHLDGASFDTDGPWLFARNAAGVAFRILPAHAVVDVRLCEEGRCGANRPVR